MRKTSLPPLSGSSTLTRRSWCGPAAAAAPPQFDDLVPQDGAALGNPPPLDRPVHGVVLQAGDEEHPRGRQPPEPRVVHVAPIHDHNGPGVKAQGAGHAHVMPLALGDDDYAGEIAVVAQQAMQLDRPLGAPEVRPVEQRRTQIDDRGIQTHQLVLEPKLPPPLRQGLAACQQFLEHRAIELPGAMRVGVGQRRAARRGDAQVLELAFTPAQPATNLSQGMGAAELAEQHRHKLAPAAEPAGVALRVRALHQPLGLRPRKQLEQLAEHAAKSTHGCASCWVRVSNLGRSRPHLTSGGASILSS